MVTLATAPTGAALDSVQRALAEFDNTPAIVRPPGGFRVKRCATHGLRCDGSEWLCEFCKPRTPEECAAKERLIRSYASSNAYTREEKRDRSIRRLRKNVQAYSDTVHCEMRKREFATIEELAGHMNSILKVKRTVDAIYQCVRRMRQDGRIEGMRVVEDKA
jgi:hypothetical protein